MSTIGSLFKAQTLDSVTDQAANDISPESEYYVTRNLVSGELDGTEKELFEALTTQYKLRENVTITDIGVIRCRANNQVDSLYIRDSDDKTKIAMDFNVDVQDPSGKPVPRCRIYADYFCEVGEKDTWTKYISWGGPRDRTLRTYLISTPRLQLEKQIPRGKSTYKMEWKHQARKAACSRFDRFHELMRNPEIQSWYHNGSGSTRECDENTTGSTISTGGNVDLRYFKA